MRRWIAVPTLFLVAVLTLPAAAQAPTPGLFLRGWGVRAGLSGDPDQGFAGVHLDLAEVAEHLRLQPNFELGLGDDVTTFSINGDLFWTFETVVPRWRPYVGGEVSWIYQNLDLPATAPPGIDDTDTDLGLSALGGFETSLAGGTRLLFELKIGLVDAPDLKLLGGVTF